MTLRSVLSLLLELFQFLLQRKRWWLVPMVAVLVLLGALIVLGNATSVGPFIYTLF